MLSDEDLGETAEFQSPTGDLRVSVNIVYVDTHTMHRNIGVIIVKTSVVHFPRDSSLCLMSSLCMSIISITVYCIICNQVRRGSAVTG